MLPCGCRHLGRTASFPCALTAPSGSVVTPQSFLLWTPRGGFAFPDVSPVYRKSERRLRLGCLRSFPRLREKKIKNEEKEFAALFLPRRRPGVSGDLGFHMTHASLCHSLTDFSPAPVARVTSVLPFENWQSADAGGPAFTFFFFFFLTA